MFMNKPSMKLALAVALAAAAIVGPRQHIWITVGLLVFGAFNLLATTPGTHWVRGVSVAVATLALLWAPWGALTVILALLIWPPTFMASWAIGQDAAAITAGRVARPEAVVTPARISTAGLIIAVAIASVVYRLIFARGLQQTAALFVGIPAILAVFVVFAASPRSAVGVACKAVTVGLLVSMMFLGEGIVCIMMSAPLFYAVAIGVASTMTWVYRRRDGSTVTLRSCVVLLLVVPMSLEGVTEWTSFDRAERVAASKIVDASFDAVSQALFEQPRFDRVRPLYLRAGFPVPVATAIERTAGTGRWTISFRGGEMRLDGIEARSGDLVLELDEARPGFVRWRAVSDSSHMTHFLNWGDVTVQWEPAGSGKTRVTWTLEYRRGLDPAWYFGPWQRYAMRLAAGYLIDAVATP
jgi:hypothetical protein